MSLQAVLALALYIVVVALVGGSLIWATRVYAPAELQMLLQGGIVIICILLVLMRLAGYV